MAAVVKLRSAEQIEYRLSGQCGCDHRAHDHDAAGNRQVEYRLGGADRPLERIGSGWGRFGRAPGTTVDTEAEVDEVRAALAGRDPRTGEQLVAPKTAVDPRAKLSAQPLVEAVRAVAAAADPSRHEGMDPVELLGSERLAARWRRLERGVLRDGAAHRAAVGDLEAVAGAAGIDPGILWEAGELARARRHADDRVAVGNMGYDLVLNMPKSMSVAYGLMDEADAAEFEEIYLDSVRETVQAVEEWTAYGLAGHHGDGARARRVESAGFAATVTLHRSARPVAGQAGDPHIHAHVTIPNLIECEDGRWRTLAAGGRDLHRHVAVAGELAKARMRRRLSERYGAVWKRDERSGEWEIAGFDARLRSGFSSRARQIDAHAAAGASTAQRQAVARALAEAKRPDQEPGSARRSWRRRAREAGYDPDAVLAAGLPGLRSGVGRGGARVDLQELCAAVWDPETGVTAQRKVATRTQVMAAVLQALPQGVSGLSELEVLTDAVLRGPDAVALGGGPQTHLSNSAQWTSRRIVESERTITLSARRRLGAGAAAVPVEQAEQALAAFEERRGFALSGEQRACALRLLVEGHGVEAVRGVAGAGKTTLMSAVFEGWSAQGLRVAGAATAAVAAANLEAESGIAARTVASWLARIESGEGLEGVDVLVIDEAAMVDDHSMAALTAAAERAGTKVVGIGDPAQLRAVGVGGSFAEVHRIVGGHTLRENRRQRRDVDRKALELWVEGGHSSALAVWGGAGRVHAARRAHEAHAAIAQAWLADRRGIADPHRAAEDVLVLAARNSDVDELNARMRSLARDAGWLGEAEVGFALRGGGRLELSAGDVVRVRRNDYRSRRGEGPDVLNGVRGVVAEVDARRGVRVRWRSREGERSAWFSPEALARGDVSLGYAMTIAAAQGLTCERVHVYGIGADANSLYPAMTRSRERADLYLAAEALQGLDPTAFGSDRALVQAAIGAYGRDLEARKEVMVGALLEARRGEGTRRSAPPSIREALRRRHGADRGGPRTGRGGPSARRGGPRGPGRGRRR
ncbi:AAA family ATPase [Nocardiopsis sp. CNT-189]|uniref:MobF family relaxase n=1 Tax=Nocardiopsis oceanisediminis TaxID=2816862 RepID=UPI003B325B74